MNGLPVATRHLLDEPLALRRSPVEVRRWFHRKNKPLRIKPRLLLLQRLTCGGDVGTVLLGDTQTFL
jgi:hypothetical protein